MTWRIGIFEQFLLATAVLTRLPVVPREPGEPGETVDVPAAGAVAAAGWAFPAVGAGIGMIAALVLFVASSCGLDEGPAALLALVAAGFLTGALHEDGLADTADGLGGGRDRAEKLAIMRDSRQGTYGIIALVLSIGLRAVAVASIPGPIEGGLALIAAHAASRAALPPAMLWLAPARPDGLGAMAGTPSRVTALVAVLLGAFVAIGMLGPLRGAVAIVLSGMAVAATAALARRQIGGYTGDVLGAFQQVGEIVMLLVAAAR
ncbi:MAG TPA: adenosylcobinamide-GDP ribazoletransferase [Stellaceae bacterium]|nr:adenosylcobinamide-GDP ribazoletransferase [Stellaceae bacterium]